MMTAGVNGADKAGMFDDKMSGEWRPGHHGRCTHGTGGAAADQFCDIHPRKIILRVSPVYWLTESDKHWQTVEWGIVIVTRVHGKL